MKNYDGNPSSSSATILDAYFLAAAKGPDYRRKIAMQLWRVLSPIERNVLQTEARDFAGGDVRLSGEYAQSVLLLEHVNRQAETLASVSGDGASILPPAA